MSAPLPLAPADRTALARMNLLSLEQSFDPAVDIDWSGITSEDEFLALYDAWSLLRGSGRDRDLDARARIDFARYQQINLMLFTALLEHEGLRVLRRLQDDENEPEMVAALAHFVREETRHHAMFMRAVAKLEAEMPVRRPLPRRHLEVFLRAMFTILAFLPARGVRVSAGFLVLEFAERISLLAHSEAERVVPRPDSFVPRVWALHAVDEARHLGFDLLIAHRYGGGRAVRLAVKAIAAPLAMLSSLLLNLNDAWAARQVGARLSLWHTPLLMRCTTAPFKRRVFATIAKLFARPA